MAFNSDDEILLDEIENGAYGFTPEIMMEIVDSDTKNIRCLLARSQSIHTACMKEEISITLTT